VFSSCRSALTIFCFIASRLQGQMSHHEHGRCEFFHRSPTLFKVLDKIRDRDRERAYNGVIARRPFGQTCQLASRV
jgi:hypothetical protein